MDKQESLPFLEEVEVVKPTTFCRTCKHRQRWQCGGSIIQYCGARKSNRTDNGLLKIKVTLPSCIHYEPEPTKDKK